MIEVPAFNSFDLFNFILSKKVADKINLKYNLSFMGCGHPINQVSQKKQEGDTPVLQKNIGLLRVQIRQLNLMSSFTIFNSKYLKLTNSNQSYLTAIHHNFGHFQKIVSQRTEFDFTINKIVPSRNLKFQVFGQEELKPEKIMGFVQVDVLKYDNVASDANQPNNETKIAKLYSSEGANVGWVCFWTKFTPEIHHILNIKVNSVTLRNFTTSYRKVYVRMEVGEETYESSSADEALTLVPKWSDAMYSFFIPASLQEGKLQIYEKNQDQNFDFLLGELTFDIKKILSVQGLQFYCEPIFNEDQVAGSVQVQFLKSKDKIFESDQIDSPKRISIRTRQNKRNTENINKINSLTQFRRKMDLSKSNIKANNVRPKPFSGRIKQNQELSSKVSDLPSSRPLLRSIQTAPIKNRRWKDKQNFKRNDFQIEENPQSSLQESDQISELENESDDDFNIKNVKINMMKTQSFLFKKNSPQNKKNVAKFFNDNSQKKSQLIKQNQVEDSSINNMKNQQQLNGKQQAMNEPIKSNKYKLPKLNKQGSLIKSNNKKILPKLKFKPIPTNLQSKPLEEQNKNYVYIDISSGYSQFNLSLRSESNLHEKKSDQQFQFMNLKQPNQIQNEETTIQTIKNKNNKTSQFKKNNIETQNLQDFQRFIFLKPENHERKIVEMDDYISTRNQ